MIGTWLLELNERWDHQGRLLPYLLSALIDSSAAVQQRALQHLDTIGALYEADHEKDLKDVLAYLPSEAHSMGWRDTDAVWTEQLAAQRRILPAQFAARPRLGTRRVVAANFGHICHAICLELVSWQAEHRAKAAQLLAVYLVHIEDWAQQYVHELVPALCRALALQLHDRTMRDAPDTEQLIEASAAARCCALMGLLASSTSFLSVVLPRIEDDSAELALQEAALLAATCNMHASACSTDGVDVDVQQILDALQASGLPTHQQVVCKRRLLSVLHACACCVQSSTLQDTVVQLLAMIMHACGRPEQAVANAAQSTAKAAMCAALSRHVSAEHSGAVDGHTVAPWPAVQSWLHEHSGDVSEALAVLGEDATDHGHWWSAT